MSVLTTNIVCDVYYSVKYSFDVSSKAIVLKGDSSTGKSLLFTLFRNQVSHNYPTITIDNAAQFNQTDITSGSNFIVIDRFDVWGNTDMQRKINRAIGMSQNKFIIISRYFGFAVPKEGHKNLIYKDNILQFE